MRGEEKREREREGKGERGRDREREKEYVKDWGSGESVMWEDVVNVRGKTIESALKILRV